MNYDFTSILDRRGRDALAVEQIPMAGAQVLEGFDPIPMWVADMNFPTAPTVVEAMMERVQHPAYGYFSYSKEYYEAIIRWQRSRNGVEGLTAGHIGYQNGVLGGMLSALEVLGSAGEPVLVHAPTYIGFTSALERKGYRLVHSPLALDEQGVYRMDYADMEEKIRKERIHTAILCSPHNPTGRVWEREELEQAYELFRKYDVYVLSDEIWSDLLLFGHRHLPSQQVSEDAKQRTVAFYAPSKTFNLAGLVGAYHIAYDPWLRDRLRRESERSMYNHMNVLSMHALIGGYRPEGQEWVDQLCQVLSGNVDLAVRFIRERFPGVFVSRPQGTYMLFLDCGEWCLAHDKTLDELLRAGYRYGVIWQDGRPFHGASHIRMNLALPQSRVEEAFERLEKYVFCGNW